jgi:hypothetical protein
MNPDMKWVPMRWPCGPLEIARRSRLSSFTADMKNTLEAWEQPSTLELLKGTPVNCLVVEWANGKPEDSAQQQALKPLLEAGRGLGISFVGKVAVKENAGAVVAAARAAGLAAVMMRLVPGQAFDLPAIALLSREKVSAGTASAIFCTSENAWPGVNLETMAGDSALAGATSNPWVNSNAWFSLLAAELAPGTLQWLDFDPPDGSSLAHPANYGLAVADSRAYGSRWIISLDDKLRAALPKGDSQAKAVWEKLCRMLAFFESHAGWEAFQTEAVLGVISDFRGDNAYLSGESLNLLNRRQVQFRVLERAKPIPPPSQGLKALLWLDKDEPSAEQHSQLLEFVRQGGLLIAQAYWGPADVKPTKGDSSLHYDFYNVGSGQFAVAEEGFQAPDQVAVDTHMLLSRRNDLVRLYNPGAANCHSSVDPARRKRLVQVLNYSVKPAESITLWVNDKAASARLWQPAAQDATTLPGVAASPGPGTEFHLPQLATYCALEMEGSSL